VNAPKSDWTVFHTTAKRNTQEGRSVMLINVKKRPCNANGNILLQVCWLAEGGRENQREIRGEEGIMT